LLAVEDGGTKHVNPGISLLTVSRTTGALRYASRWAGSNTASPILLSSGEISFNPGGNLLAVMTTGIEPSSDQEDSVTILSVRRRTLAPVAHTQFEDGIGGSVAFSPNGGLVAIANSGSDNVLVLRVNQRTGTLHRVPGSPFGAGSTPASLAFSPDGGLLAIVNADAADFSVFSVNESTGTLRPVPGSPFGKNVADIGDWIAFSSRDNLLAYGAGIGSPNDGSDSQRVAVFSTPFCTDPDHDGDCDPS
jgi:6-phosphogluconolactonase (cycloisomerase 2 family)